MANSTNALLQHYVKLVEFLGYALGPDYEVALHDLTDKTRSIIYAMEAYVLQHINLDGLVETIDNCAGAVMGSLTTQSDGDSNEFTLNFDLYVCDAVFVDA